MKTPQRIITFCLYSIVVILLSVAGYLVYDDYVATHTGPTVPSEEIVTVSTPTPSEQTPPEPAQAPYTVPAAHPRQLIIPSIGVSSLVQKVGIDQTQHIAVPNNIYFTGWYVNSALPGQPGVTIIDGHVGGRYNRAVFSDLKNVTEGAEVQIQRGDYSTVTYKVAQKIAILPEDGQAVFKKYLNTPSEVHIVTCHGTFIPSGQTYDHRLIVVAGLVQ